jgi:diguanylate cyclase (GGDEF)-like protein/PAS domain S-box-containing protein
MPDLDATDLYDGLLDRLFDGVLILDRHGSITHWNKSAERISGHRAVNFLGQKYTGSPVQHIGEDGREAPAGYHLILATLKDGNPREGRAFLKHAEGFRLPVAIRTMPIRDAKGNLVGAAEIFNDNKSILAALQNVPSPEATILFDPLTGIGNRPHIELKLRMALHAYLGGGLTFGVLFMDIDHFKNFNDTYGHLTGDKVLRYVANSICNNLRVSDSCGRWGGEEFIAVLMDVDTDSLAKVAEKLRRVVAHTEVVEGGRQLGVTISIGGTLVQPDDTLQSLIQRVDKRMYKSKEDGRNRVTVDD